jgi:hypothetical protein
MILQDPSKYNTIIYISGCHNTKPKHTQHDQYASPTHAKNPHQYITHVNELSTYLYK